MAVGWPGLKYGDDGSLTVYIQSERPPKDLESNWLPAPPDRFVMILRAHSPRKVIVDHSYRWPPVRKIGEWKGERRMDRRQSFKGG